jgi:hypothetical protein
MKTVVVNPLYAETFNTTGANDQAFMVVQPLTTPLTTSRGAAHLLTGIQTGRT